MVRVEQGEAWRWTDGGGWGEGEGGGGESAHHALPVERVCGCCAGMRRSVAMSYRNFAVKKRIVIAPDIDMYHNMYIKHRDLITVAYHFPSPPTPDITTRPAQCPTQSA